MTSGRFHIVLVAPEIPPNTGTTARLCAATNTALHLVGPLGFSIENRYLRRAGLDYWPHVDLHTYPDWDRFLAARSGAKLRLFSARAGRPYTSVRYEPDDYLVFGCETRGLPAALLERYAEQTFTIPMSGRHVRSLNLANAAAIVLYEALRQVEKS